MERKIMDKQNTMNQRDKRKRIVRLFFSFFKIGLFTVGGGMAMIPLIEDRVLREKWLKPEDMVDCIAISQSLPGVIGVNMATYVGRKTAGPVGSLVATLGITLPSFLIILILSYFLEQVGANPRLEGALMGIRAGVCGLIAVTLFRMGKRTLRSPFAWTMALGALIAVVVAKVSAALVVGVALACGWIYGTVKKRRENHG